MRISLISCWISYLYRFHWLIEASKLVIRWRRSSTAKQASSADEERQSFADGSPILQELKEELLARGMSDEKAEAYLRQL